MVMVPIGVSLINNFDIKTDLAGTAFISRNVRHCLQGSTSKSGGSEHSSKIGGNALLPLACDYPRDKQGRAMEFVGQLNFDQISLPPTELPVADGSVPDNGILSIFWNANRDFSNPKDPGAFKIIWSPRSGDTFQLYKSGPDFPSVSDASYLDFSLDWSVPASASDWEGEAEPNLELADQFIRLMNQEKALQVFGHGDKNFAKLREMAAFASNGISWSQERSQDSCYAHLVDASKNWILLLKVKSLKEWGVEFNSFSHGESLYLLINKEDLKSQNLEKAWLLVD